jgi:hypothetical protein
MKTAWLKNILLILIVEKFIQHIIVSLAFYYDWTGIRSTVAVSPDLLIVLGIILAFLFALSFLGNTYPSKLGNKSCDWIGMV